MDETTRVYSAGALLALVGSFAAGYSVDAYVAPEPLVLGLALVAIGGVVAALPDRR